jgi:hypothetical protein
VAEEDEGGESEEERADDSYMQIEFPTLNPIVSTLTSLPSSGGPTASSSAAGTFSSFLCLVFFSDFYKKPRSEQ